MARPGWVRLYPAAGLAGAGSSRASKPADAGKPAPVAAKAAAIDAAQAHPLTWKTVVRRALAVAAAGAALYLVLPSLIAVLGAWPRLSTLSPAWFAVAIAAELVSFIGNFALQRLALRTRGRFAVVTAGLAGNTVTDSLPGGDASGAPDQFRMLTTAGFDTDTAVGGLTAFSLLGVGERAADPGRHACRRRVLATLAYRIATYWLPLLAGLPAYLLFRHRYGRPAPRRATPGEADQPSAGS